MYKIIVVEDEKAICNKLALYFEKTFLGAELAGKFYDGKSAWEFIENNDVDIILTDIRMPGYDGLELTERIRKYYHDIKVIILSGYREFEYAQKAVSLSVEEYLLKPIDFNKLGSIVRNLVKKLDKTKLEQERKNDKMHFFSNIIYGLANVSEFSRESLIEMGVNDEKLNGHIVEIKSDVESNSSFREYDDNLAAFFCNIINMDKKQNAAFPGMSEKDRCIVILFGKFEDFSEDEKLLSDITSTQVQIVLISDFSGINDFYEKIQGLRLIDEIDALGAAFLDGNIQDFEMRFAAMIGSGDCKAEFTRIADNLVRKFNRLYSSQIEEYNYDGKLSLRENINKFSNHCKNSLRKYNNSESSFLANIDRYLAENVKRKITREEVAKKFFLDPFYFSRYFKKISGYTFSEYSMKFKIDEAIKLMHGNMSLSEIAESLGYNNYKYFVNHFKRVTGKGPSEYRNDEIT